MRAYKRKYNYDKLGNILQMQQSKGNNFTRNFNYGSSNNKLADVKTGSDALIQDFTYDASGNQLTAGNNRHYDWNAANMMIGYKNQTGSSNPTIFAQYDYAGQNRVSKMIRTGTDVSPIYERTIYIDGIFEYHILENGTTYEKNYIHIMDSLSRGLGNTSRIAMVRIGDAFPDDISESITYNLEDQIGSSTLRLKTTGAIIDKQEYYPFGDSSLRTFTKKRYQYTGKERDEESGLYYYGARYYATWTCRFTSTDPLQGDYPNFSTYAYAFNNPLAFNDPTGMEGEKASASEDNISTDGGGDTASTDGGGGAGNFDGGDTTETDKGITLPEIEVHGEDLSEKVSPIDIFDQSDILDNRDIQRPNDSQAIKKGDVFLDENGAGHIASFDEFVVEGSLIKKEQFDQKGGTKIYGDGKVDSSLPKAENPEGTIDQSYGTGSPIADLLLKIFEIFGFDMSDYNGGNEIKDHSGERQADKKILEQESKITVPDTLIKTSISKNNPYGLIYKNSYGKTDTIDWKNENYRDTILKYKKNIIIDTLKYKY